MPQVMPWEEYSSTPSDAGGGQGVVIPVAPEKPKEPPSGYRWTTNGGLEPIPGGPAIPKPETAPEQAPYSQSALDAFDRAIATADRLMVAPGLPSAVGSGFDPAAIGSFNPVTGKPFSGTKAADFMADLEAMKAQVFLPMVQSMRGMGQLSNAEGQKLTDAIGALDPNMSEEAFKASLARIKDDLISYRNRSAPLENQYASPAAEEKKIIGAGERFMTEQDKALQAELQGAFDRGAGVEELSAIGARYGRPALQGIEQAIQARDSGTKGIKATVDPTGTGQEDAGMLSAYATGAANALTAGQMDELAAVMGLDPAQVEAGKRYLAEKQGLAYGVGEITGGALAMVPANRMAQVAGAGAYAPLVADVAYGGAYGAGEQNENRLGGAIMGGTLSGAGGAVARRAMGALSGQVAPEAADALSQADQANIPVMTSDIAPPQTFMGKGMQQIGERIPIAGTGGVRAAQQSKRQEAVQALLADYGVGAEGILDKVTQSLTRAREADLTKFTDMKKEVVSSLAGAGVVPVPNAVKAIDNAIATLNGIDAATYGPVITKLQSQRTNIAEGKSLDQLEGVRKILGGMFDDPNLASIKGDGQKAVNSIYGPLAEDIKVFIRERAGQPAANKWAVANKRLSEMAGELKNNTMKAVLRQADVKPERVASLLFSSSPSDIRALYRSLPPEGRANARAAIVDKVFRDLKVNNLESVSPDQFLNRLRDQAKSIGVFFSGEEADRLTGLMRALQVTSRAGKANVLTETGQQMVPLTMVSALAGLVGGVGGQSLTTGGASAVAAAMAGIGLGGLTRILESKPVRNAVLRMRNSKVGTPEESKAAEAVRNAITMFANREYQTNAKPNEAPATAKFEVPTQ